MSGESSGPYEQAIANCDHCPLVELGDLQSICLHPEAGYRDALFYQDAPSWCPLRSRALLLFRKAAV